MSSRKDNLIEAFDALKLALLPRKHDKPKPQTQIQQQANAPRFVGGFNPSYAPPTGSYQEAGPWSSSKPQVMMPVPDGRMSMTMQHALDLASGASPNLLSTYSPPSRPHSASIVPNAHSSNSAASRPKPSSSPSRPRASSEPTESPPRENQCEGITKTGKRCTRQVKDGHPLNITHPDAQVERFCHQHSKEVLSPSGFYARNGGAWIKFEGLSYVCPVWSAGVFI
jgi:hypothetical protein